MNKDDTRKDKGRQKWKLFTILIPKIQCESSICASINLT